jgi:hypothetical protein
MAVTAASPSKLIPLQTPGQPAGYPVNMTGQAENPYTPGHWSQSLVIRVMLGLLVTAGVTLMLIRATELILTWDAPLGEFWKSISGFIVWQSLELVGVFLGAMMAVAGRNEMLTVGFLLGTTVGFLTLIILPTNQNIPQPLYFAMPAWFTVAGALGAWIGESLWHPQHRKSIKIISSRTLTQDQQESNATQLLRQAVLGLIFANIRWLKVILAVVIILPTLWYTHEAVSWVMLKLGLSAWVVEVGLQKAWVETMVKIIVIMLAAAMTGAGTTHGIAHGFWTGVICGVLNLLQRVLFPSEDGLNVNAILWEVAWCFLLCVISGAFGALIIPPIMYLAQKRRHASIR